MDEELFQNIAQKQLVFCVTTGRTGTTLLTKLLSGLQDVVSLHEPKPYFHSIMRRSQRNPYIIPDFWEEKLKVIGSIDCKVYVETSNVFSKGFLIPLLRMGIRPKLIFLNRNVRDIALSLLSRGSIPGKSENGLIYSAAPGDPLTLPLYGAHWTDYQRCYWAAIDTIFKQKYFQNFYGSYTAGIFSARTEKITKLSKFCELVEFIYPPGHDVSSSIDEKFKDFFERNSSVIHNPNSKKLSQAHIENIDDQERFVVDYVNFYFPFDADDI